MSLRSLVSAALAAAAVTLASGCATYTAKPITPAATAAALEQRTLDDPKLAELISTALPQRAATAGGVNWDLSTLTLATLYFHPEMEISRSKLALARAGVTTAGQTPNPTLNLDPTRHGVIVDPSPWTVGILLNLVLEAGGRREKRLEQARHLVDAARQDLATAAWQVRGGVRSSLLDLWAANGRVRLTALRLSVQQQIVDYLERRFTAGDVSALDVARERINLSQARLAAKEAERQAADARARLATAVGVPLRALDSVQLTFGDFDKPAEVPDLAALSTGARAGPPGGIRGGAVGIATGDRQADPQCDDRAGLHLRPGRRPLHIRPQHRAADLQPEPGADRRGRGAPSCGGSAIHRAAGKDHR
ncbi:MAG: TolC family protein [Alphaproteobacteria bacterium]|nr:TolC family protein [Alphaproteobacteria bacterium]